MAVDGLTTVRSSYGPKETISRLEDEIRSRGMTVFARIDHMAGRRRLDYRCDRPKFCCSAMLEAVRR